MEARKAWDVPHLAAGSQKPNIDPEMVTVYNMRYCPYAERTILVLLAKKIPFVNININLLKKPQWFLDETEGKVPAILYKGNILEESLIISDFIDEEFPEQPLLAASPAQRAKDRMVVERSSKAVTTFYRLVLAKTEQERTEAMQVFEEELEKLEKEFISRGTIFFAGDHPGMVDYMLWPWFERLDLVMDQLPHRLTGLSSWVESMWKTGPVAEYGLDSKTHQDFYTERRSKGVDCNFDFGLPQ